MSPMKYILPGAEFIVSTFSRVGREKILNLDYFPWAEKIESKADDIRNELSSILYDVKKIPDFHFISEKQKRITSDEKWKVFPFSVFGRWIDVNCQKCPITANALTEIPDLQNSMFSILGPGKYIPPHRGPYNGLLRYHLGLLIPNPKSSCRIRVGDEIVNWSYGNSVVFDDTYEHEVWNDSDEYRVVLFADFLRPLPRLAAVINKALVNYIARPYVLEGKEKLAAWDKMIEAAERLL